MTCPKCAHEPPAGFRGVFPSVETQKEVIFWCPRCNHRWVVSRAGK